MEKSLVEELILGMADIVYENRKLKREVKLLSKKTNDIMKEHIDFLELSNRLSKVLKRYQIDTVEKLCNKSYHEFYIMHGLGESCLKELTDVMRIYDLHFKKDCEE